MSKSQRTKGAAGEREVCALLRDHFGVEVSRKLGQARDSGEDISLPPFRIEVKRRDGGIAALRWLEQAESGAKVGEVPTVVLREDRGAWAVLMRFDDWAKLAREEVAK